MNLVAEGLTCLLYSSIPTECCMLKGKRQGMQVWGGGGGGGQGKEGGAWLFRGLGAGVEAPDGRANCGFNMEAFDF